MLAQTAFVAGPPGHPEQQPDVRGDQEEAAAHRGVPPPPVSAAALPHDARYGALMLAGLGSPRVTQQLPLRLQTNRTGPRCSTGSCWTASFSSWCCRQTKVKTQMLLLWTTSTSEMLFACKFLWFLIRSDPPASEILVSDQIDLFYLLEKLFLGSSCQFLSDHL